jgi:putative flippase GtrA
MASSDEPPSRAWLKDSRVRYLIAGSTVFGVNVVAFQALLWAVPDTAVARNVANVLATELSYLYGYGVHALFTWRKEPPSWRGLGKFHVVSGFGFVLRSMTFGLLDYWGVLPPLVTLVVSIGVQLCSNFLGYERWVFTSRSRPR